MFWGGTWSMVLLGDRIKDFWWFGRSGKDPERHHHVQGKWLGGPRWLFSRVPLSGREYLGGANKNKRIDFVIMTLHTMILLSSVAREYQQQDWWRVSRYQECITERTVSTIWWTKSCRETTEARFWISMRMQMFIVCECHLLFAISFHSFPPCPQQTQEVSLFRKCERDIEPEVSTRDGLFVAGPSTPTTPPNSFQQLPCQACAERGLRLIYCVVNGHQIGANVWDPGSWWPLESYFVP